MQLSNTKKHNSFFSLNRLSSSFYFVFFIFYFLFSAVSLYGQTTEWKLTWDKNQEPNVTEYWIYRSMELPGDQTDFTRIAIVPQDTAAGNNGQDSLTITFVDNALQRGTLFHYTVKAVVDESCQSDFSDTVSAAIPLIKDIPDTCIKEDGEFTPFCLDDFLVYPDGDPADISWNASGCMQLDVQIDSLTHMVSITLNESMWRGTECICFMATDSRGFSDTIHVNFGVMANQLPVIDIVNPTKNPPMIDTVLVLTEDTPFACFDSIWYDFVDDPDDDDPDDELIYRIIGSRNINLRDSVRYRMLLPRNNFCFRDTLQLIVSDGNASDSAYFAVEVLPVNDAPLPFYLMGPDDRTTFTTVDSLCFEWTPASDPDRDTITYQLHLFDETGAQDTVITSINSVEYVFHSGNFLRSGNHYLWHIMASDGSAETSSDTAGFFVDYPSGIEDPWSEIPRTFQVHQNYPNPFNPTTTIRYAIPEAGPVTIEVFNTIGQKVATLVDAVKPAGYHVVTFDGSRLSSGLYFYHLRSGAFSKIRKMILRK